MSNKQEFELYKILPNKFLMKNKEDIDNNKLLYVDILDQRYYKTFLEALSKHTDLNNFKIVKIVASYKNMDCFSRSVRIFKVVSIIEIEDIKKYIIENNFKQGTQQKKIIAARYEIGLDELVHDNATKVRVEVAKHGKYLEELRDDASAVVRQELVKQGFELYRFVRDGNAAVRADVARQGYALDILKEDKSPIVRRVARDYLLINGYDKDPVHKILKIEYTHDIKRYIDTNTHVAELLFHKYLSVREMIADKGMFLSVLSKDPEPSVRAAVVRQGYITEALKNDSAIEVKVALIQQGINIEKFKKDSSSTLKNALIKYGYIPLDPHIKGFRELKLKEIEEGKNLDIYIKDEDLEVVEAALLKRLQYIMKSNKLKSTDKATAILEALKTSISGIINLIGNKGIISLITETEDIIMNKALKKLLQCSDYEIETPMEPAIVNKSKKHEDQVKGLGQSMIAIDKSSLVVMVLQNEKWSQITKYLYAYAKSQRKKILRLRLV